MAGRRRWVLSGTLLTAAAGLTAASTWRHWTSCRPDDGTAACQALREDTYGLPLWGESAGQSTVDALLAVAAAVLLTGAWLAVVDWARTSAARTIMAAVVGLQPLLVAVLAGLELVGSDTAVLVGVGAWLTWPAELLVLPLLLGAGWVLDEAPLQTVRLIVLGWAVTSFGSLHHFVDHVGSSIVFGGVADSPPGLGYVTAATQAVLGVVVLVSGLLPGPRREPEEGDEWFGRDGFTLAA